MEDNGAGPRKPACAKHPDVDCESECIAPGEPDEWYEFDAISAYPPERTLKNIRIEGSHDGKTWIPTSKEDPARTTFRFIRGVEVDATDDGDLPTSPEESELD